MIHKHRLLIFVDEIIDELVEAEELIIYDRSSDEEADLKELKLRRAELKKKARQLIGV